MKERKIIQISTCRVEYKSTTQCEYITNALCDDGTVWELQGCTQGQQQWFRLPYIPQPCYICKGKGHILEDDYLKKCTEKVVCDKCNGGGDL